jgi:hypothetical protein
VIEMESVKFTKQEVIELLDSVYACGFDEARQIIDFLTKLGVLSEYIFKEEKKK